MVVWTSVKHSMPVITERVIVTTDRNFVGECMQTGNRWVRNDSIEYDFEVLFGKVIAWMPLPEFY